MGDFNAHLPDLITRLRDLDSTKSVWTIHTATNTSSAVRTGRWAFTSQHEANFIAAYDGVLTRGLLPQGSGGGTASTTVVTVEGYMPKYLGDDGVHGPSSFRYSGGSFPASVEGDLMINGFKLPGNRADQSRSDHLPVSAKFHTL